MTRISYNVVSPEQCSDGEIRAFCQLVSSGDKVQSTGLRSRVERAPVLSYAIESEIIVGVGAIKKPAISYQKKVFAKAQVAITASEQWSELGYMFTREQMRGRGIGKTTVSRLVATLGDAPCFATTSDERMASILTRQSFRQMGVSYPDRSGNEALSLFVRGPAR